MCRCILRTFCASNCWYVIINKIDLHANKLLQLLLHAHQLHEMNVFEMRAYNCAVPFYESCWCNVYKSSNINDGNNTTAKVARISFLDRMYTLKYTTPGTLN